MAPSAIKRRKLEHSDSDEASEASFAGFDEADHVLANGHAEEDVVNSSDVSMDGLEDFDDDDVDDDDDDEQQQHVHASRKPAISTAPTTAQKPPKRPSSSFQDGVYTAESFKSNIFKLQLDELLEQVKPRYGKKEAPVENAMRTLKSIFEQIPNREPLSVCPIRHFIAQPA